MLAAATAAASAEPAPDWAMRLWASTAARMLWAAILCLLLLGHSLASRPLFDASGAENAAPVRTLATLLELPANSFAIIASAVRPLQNWEKNAAVTLASRTRLEAVLAETGG